MFVLPQITDRGIQKESFPFSGPSVAQREATNRQNEPDNRAKYCGEESFIREPVGNEKEQCRSEH
jgi:hypothetical protein